jgi:hypothetical protein
MTREKLRRQIPETEEPLPGERNNQASGGGEEAMAEEKKPGTGSAATPGAREAGRLGGARAQELLRRGKALEAAGNKGG